MNYKNIPDFNSSNLSLEYSFKMYTSYANWFLFSINNNYNIKLIIKNNYLIYY